MKYGGRFWAVSDKYLARVINIDNTPCNDEKRHLKMSTVPIGKFLRRLRIDYDERLFDMAKKVGVSSAFLSAVENGHKKASNPLINKISKIYNLTPSQKADLYDDVAISQQDLNLSAFSQEKQQAIIMFAIKFDGLSESQHNAIKRILEE
ncbi:helix-turn-helix domain-containing protein [Bombilactobacillus bombi]|nr:helix-turn-helix transcriptional regulator [Bombilactobacillus bombi]